MLDIFRSVPFNALAFRKVNGKLEFVSCRNYETRNESTARLISTADYLYGFKDFDWVMVNTDDRDHGDSFHGLKLLSYCTATNSYNHVVPDFLFDNWPQTQFYDYNESVNELGQNGDIPAETNLLGWRGAMTHPNRRHLLKFTDKSKYDIEEIVWDRTNPDKLVCHNFVSMTDAPKKWRYLIDVEGNGWSARVKVFLFSKRVLFLQDRPYKEWWYEKLSPWAHYVPVNSDLSDLEHNLNIIRNDPVLEDEIRFNAFEFANKNLRRINAVTRWGEVLNAL